ncbi:hypothetical protein HAX54_043521 [Datura stramonium]|uniref:RWP-RK domain-containing protein n=1 Tax=Datura stramonium TaxID=4076 RepID=A0ABS8SNM3_DATST|nr:hypothetical protein [Datura stramonium]
MLFHLLQPHEHCTNAGHESPEVIVDTQTNNEKRRNKSSTPWSAAGSICKEDLAQRHGMRLREAARSLRVRVSTFKRLCRVHGISRWPSTKKTREKASVSQSPNALLSSLQHMSGLSQTTKENDMTQGRASSKQDQLYRSRLFSDSLSFENPTPNALERIPQPPENGMICEEDRETSISGQKRRLEREPDSMDEMSDFNEQPSEMLNYAAPERQAVDSARKESSCFTSINGTVEGIEVGYNPIPESVCKKQSHLSPYLDSMVFQHSSNGQQMLLHLSRTHESSTNAGHGSPGVTVDTRTKNQKTRNKSSSPWSAIGSIYLEDLVRCYGMRRYEAAPRLGVCVSTFKRLCREHGLSRWPTAKKMRENASVSQSTNALVSALQHKDANLSLNQNMPGNSETTKENKNLMMCGEDRETDISRHRRRQPEREADSMDEMIHFNKQPSETLNRAPERLAVDSARKKSSCVASLNGTIEGIGVGYNPTPDQDFFADLEKIRDLVGNSMKDEESLKVRYGELESKEKELRAQLEAVLKEKAGLTEQMHEKFKQTKHLISLADERAARTKEKIQGRRIATTKLNNLVDQWAKIQSFFI